MSAWTAAVGRLMAIESKHAFVVPFRWRGNDPRRIDNLTYVIHYLDRLNLGRYIWEPDGRRGDAPFNRSAAMNRGDEIAWRNGYDVVTHYEADMIVPSEQIEQAIELAREAPGLVVPFTRYEALTPDDSKAVLDGADPWTFTPAHVRDNGRSIGAVGTVSRATVDAIGGWPEKFEGHAYDDDACKRALEVCAGPTRWVEGPARHLWHVPGAGPTPGGGDTAASERDKAATAANKALWQQIRKVTDPDEMRRVLHG